MEPHESRNLIALERACVSAQGEERICAPSSIVSGISRQSENR